jgi:hypothetical protein
MSESGRTLIWQGSKQGRRSSAAEMRARIGVLEAELAAAQEREAAMAEVAPARPRARGIARILDCDERCAQGHQPLDFRSATGTRHAGGDGSAAVRCRHVGDRHSQRRSLPLRRHVLPRSRI